MYNDLSLSSIGTVYNEQSRLIRCSDICFVLQWMRSVFPFTINTSLFRNACFANGNDSINQVIKLGAV